MSHMNRLLIAAVFVALQAAFFIGWSMTEERRLNEGVSILVQPRPVDPRDLLRGQYMQLAYDFTNLEPVEDELLREQDPAALRQPGERPVTREVWVVLERAEDDLYTAVYATYEEPEFLARDQVAMRGVRSGWRNLFGIEKYFVPEGTETPSFEDVTVRLRVGRDREPRIEQVYVRNQPWP